MSNNTFRLNGHEIRTLELMMFASNLLKSDQRRFGRILDMKPEWRTRFMAMCDEMEDLFCDMAKVMPDSTKRQLQTMLEHGELSIKPKPVSHIPGYMLIPEQVSLALVKAAMEGECSMCIKDADEAEKCDLYRGICEVLAPEEMGETMICPYAGIKVETTHKLEEDTYAERG